MSDTKILPARVATPKNRVSIGRPNIFALPHIGGYFEYATSGPNIIGAHFEYSKASEHATFNGVHDVRRNEAFSKY
jgi:hypothetical protein